MNYPGMVRAKRLVTMPALPDATGRWAAVPQSQVASLYLAAAQRTASLEISRPVSSAPRAAASLAEY